MFTTGFMSNAPLFMDIVTLYFVLLPIFVAFAISYARGKKYHLHMISQMGIYILTMLFVVFFEVSIRIYGGFSVFLEQSNTSKDFFLIALAIHILIAIISLTAWSILTIKTFFAFRKDRFSSKVMRNHKGKGIFTFIGITLTSYTGFWMYYLLFLS